MTLNCPHCRSSIKSSWNVTRKGMRYTCKCGNDVTRLKLGQLVAHVRKNEMKGGENENTYYRYRQ